MERAVLAISPVHSEDWRTEIISFLQGNCISDDEVYNKRMEARTRPYVIIEVHAKKMSRKYPDCLKNIIWSFIMMLPWPKLNFNLYSRYEVWPLIKVVEPVLYKKFYN
jgi:putative ribosome biogenesis GTPase RsgA